MKTNQFRRFSIAIILAWVGCLLGCASSSVGVNPQKETHENISAEQRTALMKALRLRGSPAFYVIPNIPPKKLLNARASCAVAANDEVLALVDSSSFGSAKTCLLIATSGIYIRNDSAGASPGRNFLPHSEFVEAGLAKRGLFEFSVGGICFNTAGCSMSRGELYEVLWEAQEALRQTSKPKAVEQGSEGKP